MKATAAFRIAETHGRDEEKQALRLTLAYGVGKRDGEWCSLDYSIELASTPCHTGGLRYWFVCRVDLLGLLGFNHPMSRA